MTLKLEDIKCVYFVGIGGIGMSAIARYFNTRGIKVAGYDKTETVLTKKLVEEGIEVHYEDNVAILPSHIDMVVYTPAVPKDQSQLVHLLNRGIPVLKRAELLGIISRSSKTIAIAGTHGKTTTSSMVAHTLLKCGEPISAFLGGIMSGYETNYFLGDSEYVVVEADEFDRSFLHLTPSIAVVNSIDPDHLDIYGTEDKVRESYLSFIHKLHVGGYLLLTSIAANDLGSAIVEDLKKQYKVLIVGFDDTCDIHLSILGNDKGRVQFDYVSHIGSIEKVSLRMPGQHNVSNAAMAITIGLLLQKDKHSIAHAIENFKGIKRRFDWIVEGNITYIDDYAHHPTELHSAIAATRMVFPGRKILGIFQPHLFTRTRDFADGFAKELSQLDEVILMEIYPAREEPLEGIDASMLLNKIDHTKKYLMNEIEILAKISKKDFDVVMTLGAGNIDLLIPKIKAILENKEEVNTI